jgi:predicted MFS family arabinose efflux permease
VFLLPALGFGFLLALVIGGRPTRVLETRFRAGWLVLIALAVQLAIFTSLGHDFDTTLRGRLHLASYALLLLFAVLNLRTPMLIPVLAGLGLNAAAIASNGGKMPLSHTAAAAAGLKPESTSNIGSDVKHLHFLGDVFALPSQLPLANVFSVGDLLIGFGMMGFIVAVATDNGGASPLSLRRLLAPLQESVYRRLAAGRLISQMGDWLTIAALVGWIYETTGSTGDVAGLLLVRLAPPILGSSLAALAVDRLNKQRVLVSVELLRGVAVAGALAAVIGSNRLLVFVAIGVCGALAAVSGAVLPSLPPSILPDDQLPSANAGLGIAKDVAMAVGAAGGGIALSRIGVAPALVIDLVTFLLAAACYCSLRRLATPPSRTKAEPRPSGLRYLLGQPSLLLLITSFAAATLATGLTNATLPRFLGGSVGLGPGAYGFGIAAIAGGLALGEALVGFARVGPSAGRWIGAGLALMGGFLALLALTTHAPTALLLLGAIGFVDGTTDVLFQTIVQRRADPRYYGRIFGFSGAFMTSTMMGAFIAAPLANTVFGSEHVILAASGTLFVAGALALAAMARPQSARSGVCTAEDESPAPQPSSLRLELERLGSRLDSVIETARRLDTVLAEGVRAPIAAEVRHAPAIERAVMIRTPDAGVFTKLVHLTPLIERRNDAPQIAARHHEPIRASLDEIFRDLTDALEEAPPAPNGHGDEALAALHPLLAFAHVGGDPERAA